MPIRRIQVIPHRKRDEQNGGMLANAQNNAVKPIEAPKQPNITSPKLQKPKETPQLNVSKQSQSNRDHKQPEIKPQTASRNQNQPKGITIAPITAKQANHAGITVTPVANKQNNQPNQPVIKPAITTKPRGYVAPKISIKPVKTIGEHKQPNIQNKQSDKDNQPKGITVKHLQSTEEQARKELPDVQNLWLDTIEQIQKASSNSRELGDDVNAKKYEERAQLLGEIYNSDVRKGKFTQRKAEEILGKSNEELHKLNQSELSNKLLQIPGVKTFVDTIYGGLNTKRHIKDADPDFVYTVAPLALALAGEKMSTAGMNSLRRLIQQDPKLSMYFDVGNFNSADPEQNPELKAAIAEKET